MVTTESQTASPPDRSASAGALTIPLAEVRSPDVLIVGGKGANLAEMAGIGLPVPPGFTITTEVCTEFYRSGKKLPRELGAAITAALHLVERETGKRFGDPQNPLLVSVRSGARVSMPGMMDTVLNLGLNDQTVEGLARSRHRAANSCVQTLRSNGLPRGQKPSDSVWPDGHAWWGPA